MESYVRIGGRGFKNRMFPHMGVGGVKNGQNDPYISIEWPLNSEKRSKRLIVTISRS